MTDTLTERQETVLALVVHEYIEGAKPVGSKRLVDRYSIGVSPATVRNDPSTTTALRTSPLRTST